MRFLTLATSLALLSTPTVWGSEIVPDMTHSRLFGPNALVESVLANAATTPPTSAPTSSPDWTTGYGFTTNNVVLPPNVTLPLPPHTLNTGIIDKITGTPLVVPQPVGEQYFSALIFGASFQKLATIPLTAANKRHNYSLPYNNTGFTSVNQFPKVGAGLLTSIDIFDDEFFGIMRLNGPNPTVIRKISSISSKFGDITTLGNKYPSLNVLLGAGQIYELDYFQLAGIHGTALVAPDNSILQYPQHPNPGAQQRYITAPYVLLSHVLEQGVSKIVPIAIQLGQPYVAGSTAILYRVDYKDCQGNPRGPQGDWNYAKTIVNAADSIIHELNAHLVKTHLIEENVIIGTHVKLPQNHVISRLLIGEGHSLKTLQLNEDARNSLLPGVVDEVFAGGYTQAAVLVDGFFASYNWVGDYVKNDLQARGLLDSIQAIIVGQTLCLLPAPKDTHCLLTDWTLDGMFRYTYAQDAIASWNKLSTFVGTVLQAQYANDKAVAQDQAVQAWAAYLSTPQASLALPVGPKGAPVPVAPVPGFPSNFTTLAALTDAVTSALYKATVGHSVVNYPQPFYNAYIPVYPALAVYRPILNATTVGTGITTDAYIASALGNANTQEVMTILANGLGQPIASSGLADDTSLLHYATTAAATVAASTDKIGYALQSGAKQLLSDLTALQSTIQARDAANPPHYQYSYFDPALVANSIFA